MTVKHVLTGRKHDKLGNQTFEVLQPLKRMVHPPFTYCLSSRHLNYFISEILGQRNTWFEVSAVFVYRKHRKLSKLWCESLLNGRRTSNVWLPSMSCLRPVRTCFSVTCPRLDENDSIDSLKSLVLTLEIQKRIKKAIFTM